MGQQIASCGPPCKCDSIAIPSLVIGSASTHCICGNSFAPDAQFCRKCGRKRPTNAEYPPDVRLIAWVRRRNGVDCDFGEVFVELFGSREGVGPRKFVQVLAGHGFPEGKAVFGFIDRHSKSGLVAASDLELLQIEIEEREAEGLKHFRSFLKDNFPSPAAAWKETGKGEGDVLCESEFADAMQRLGFVVDDPLKLFHFLDKDFSGEICFSEFKAVMKAVGMAKKTKETKSVQRIVSKESNPASTRKMRKDRSESKSSQARPRQKTTGEDSALKSAASTR